ncbi:MAG: 2-hydroxyglutaryl-CoA dehydratase [Candidatus Schekmanbacteria bacterium]|nr:2-hydroxyglutaryl-CoA dehydratase [Candidatus Schekmanbacteria bacterium]
MGADAGSTTTKLVGISHDGVIVWETIEPTEPRMREQLERLLATIPGSGGSAGPTVPVVATGYGRNLVDTKHRRVTEITCHATGVYRSIRSSGTLIDIGGQDSKVIVIDAAGGVVNFAMNDKCAAGTGRFLEVVAARMRESVQDFAALALSSPEEVAISNTCTVFAESEMVSLLAQGHAIESISRGLHRALARRVASLARSAGAVAPLMMSGGGAHNVALRALLENELGAAIRLPAKPQLMGAYGAALLALRRAAA